MDNKQQSNGAESAPVVTPEQMISLGKVLLESIPSDRAQIWAGRIMKYFAEETIRRVSAGNADLKIVTKEIYQDLGGNRNQEPSAWLTNHWKEIESRYLPEIQPTLIKGCRALGLSVYPALVKKTDSRNRPYYCISPVVLQPGMQPEDESPEPTELPAMAVRYEQDLSLQLSKIGRLLFSKGMHWTSYRRFGFLTWQLGVFLFSVFFAGLLLIILTQSTRPLTGQDLTQLVLSILFPWMAFRYVNNSMTLFDDRIMIAPDWMLAWKEFGATIEIHRSPDPDGYSSLNLRRYSARCPVCGKLVKLANGGVEFPKRIVGQCEDSPREHVFSFDWVTRVGVPLRCPPVQAQSQRSLHSMDCD